MDPSGFIVLDYHHHIESVSFMIIEALLLSKSEVCYIVESGVTWRLPFNTKNTASTEIFKSYSAFDSNNVNGMIIKRFNARTPEDAESAI